MKNLLFLFLTFGLPSYSYSQEEGTPRIITVKAKDLLNIVEGKTYPYYWIAIWTPNCANAESIFYNYYSLQEKYKDKVRLLPVALVSNRDTFSRLANKYQFYNFYVIDSSYGEAMFRHLKLMEDINCILNLPEKDFNHLIINNKGDVVYRRFVTRKEKKKIEKVIKK